MVTAELSSVTRDRRGAPPRGRRRTMISISLRQLRGLHHSECYSAAIYWAIVTITSIGYGDLCPVNTHEMQVATGLMLFGSCLWAYGVNRVLFFIACPV